MKLERKTVKKNRHLLSVLCSIALLLLCTSVQATIESQTALSKDAIFQEAIKNGQTEEVRSLLADGIEVNQLFEEGVTPLHVAVINNQEEIVELLLQNNANANVPDVSIGASPLHLAALYGRANIANSLIKKGGNVNATMKFNISPLLVAAQFNQPEVIELLLNNKANINHTDQDGYSALHFSAKNGNDASAKILLDHGANVNLRDKTRNATPLMLATENKHQNVIQLFESK